MLLRTAAKNLQTGLAVSKNAFFFGMFGQICSLLPQHHWLSRQGHFAARQPVSAVSTDTQSAVRCTPEAAGLQRWLCRGGSQTPLGPATPAWPQLWRTGPALPPGQQPQALTRWPGPTLLLPLLQASPPPAVKLEQCETGTAMPRLYNPGGCESRR